MLQRAHIRRRTLMLVTMMDVRRVGMTVTDRLVRVLVRMRLARRILLAVHMLVMLVVHVAVSVCQRGVRVDVLVPLGEMQP
jgi:hypothetical protein